MGDLKKITQNPNREDALEATEKYLKDNILRFQKRLTVVFTKAQKSLKEGLQITRIKHKRDGPSHSAHSGYNITLSTIARYYHDYYKAATKTPNVVKLENGKYFDITENCPEITNAPFWIK